MATAHFNEENSADIVTGQNVNAKDERLRQVMDVITRHLRLPVAQRRQPALAIHLALAVEHEAVSLLTTLAPHKHRKQQRRLLLL